MQREFKFLLTEKNNPIGIKFFPNSPAIYENVVDFPNDENTGQDLAKRDEYINKFLFNNRNYKTLFESIPKQSNFQIGVQSATFEVRYETYKNLFLQDVNTLKNKDYAILEIKEVTGPGVSDSFEYYFFQVECIDFSKTEQGTFTFQGQLDIWTTNAEKIKAEHQVLVNRAHVDRIAYNEIRLDYVFDESTLQVEEKFLAMEPSFVNKEKTQNISTGWSSTDEEAKKLAEQTKWAVMYLEDSLAENNGIILFSNEGEPNPTNKMLLNTNILFFPVNDNVYVIYNGEQISSRKKWGGFDVQQEALKDSRVKAIHILDTLPFYISNVFYSNVVQRVQLENNIVFTLKSQDNTESAFIESKKILHLKQIIPATHITGDTTLKAILKPYSPVIKSQTELREILNETKLYTSFHIFYIIININTEEIKYSPEFFIWDEISNHAEIKMSYSFLPDKLNLIYTFDEKNNYNLLSYKGSVQADVIELPLASNPLDEYLTQNKVSSKSSLLTGSALIIGGSFLGFNGKKGLGIGGGLLGGRLISKELINRGDLNRAPKHSKNVSSNPTVFLTSGQNQRATIFSTLENTPAEKKVIFDFYTMMGYSQNRLMDFNKAKLSRFYFNYLEVDNFFNSISGNLNSSIKQQLDNDLQNGIRIWHYRSFESFKGFMNYTYENIEMNLLTFDKEKKEWVVKTPKKIESSLISKNGTRESK